jgi:hypothetical protein
MSLLQGWLAVRAMVILSLLYFIWAGRTLLSFYLLTCTFISIINSGSALVQQLFQPCKQDLHVVRKQSADHQNLTNNNTFAIFFVNSQNETKVIF